MVEAWSAQSVGGLKSDWVYPTLSTWLFLVFRFPDVFIHKHNAITSKTEKVSTFQIWVHSETRGGLQRRMEARTTLHLRRQIDPRDELLVLATDANSKSISKPTYIRSLKVVPIVKR